MTIPLISIIAAMDRNRLIGCDNRLPWRLPADLRHFQSVTMGKPIVMGRKTWESLVTPLPGRTNIVITRDRNYIAPNGVIVHSPEEALSTAGEVAEVMIIGGANLYEQMLPRADRLYLTQVESFFAGDAWFPELNPDDWLRESIEPHKPDEKNPYAYCFETLKRKASKGR